MGLKDDSATHAPLTAETPFTDGETEAQRGDPEARSSDARFPLCQTLGGLCHYWQNKHDRLSLSLGARLWMGICSGRDVNPTYCSEGGGSERWCRTRGPGERQDRVRVCQAPEPELSDAPWSCPLVPAWVRAGSKVGGGAPFSAPGPATHRCKLAPTILITTLRGVAWCLLHPFYRWRNRGSKD